MYSFLCIKRKYDIHLSNFIRKYKTYSGLTTNDRFSGRIVTEERHKINNIIKSNDNLKLSSIFRECYKIYVIESAIIYRRYDILTILRKNNRYKLERNCYFQNVPYHIAHNLPLYKSVTSSEMKSVTYLGYDIDISLTKFIMYEQPVWDRCLYYLGNKYNIIKKYFIKGDTRISCDYGTIISNYCMNK